DVVAAVKSFLRDAFYIVRIRGPFEPVNDHQHGRLAAPSWLPVALRQQLRPCIDLKETILRTWQAESARHECRSNCLRVPALQQGMGVESNLRHGESSL